MFFKNAKKYDDILSKLNDIGISLSSENNLARLLEIILEKAKSISNADNGTLYLLTHENRLKFTIMQSDSLNMQLGGTTGRRIPFAPVKLYTKTGRPNKKILTVDCVLTREAINVKDLNTSQNYDFSATKAFDRLKNYESKSVLAIPLTNKKNQVLGVLHLVNAQNKRGKIIPFSEEVQHLVESLASQAAVAIENQQLQNEQRDLLDGIIKMLALAIDAKSSHTSSHCEAIPHLVDMLAKSANKQKEGYFADFNLDEDDFYELKVAAWLHDCGKLTTPHSILDKATKLETVCDRIEMILTRFELMARDLEIEYLKRDITIREYESRMKELESDARFVRELNKGSEYVDDKKLERLKKITEKIWLPKISARIREQKLITKDEFYNLSVRKGTINTKERAIINNHIDVTIDMLESLPFPGNLRNVPEFAGGHHEHVDGTGFPRGLTRNEMSIQARMMAVADIYEALTSHDRPYKKPKKLSETLRIMKEMKENGHIDPDIFELFIKDKIYLKYARKFILPEQIDSIDVSEFLDLKKKEELEAA